ncbi:MAG: radical SAM protein [Halobacteriovoraceae bacterium]|nr:radical SAM protein [Halobacteriovoraceae bacterium]
MSNKLKFQDPYKTLKGEERAFVNFSHLNTLWLNTGTLCNLECQNCYIESGPKNDRLLYLTKDDVLPYIKEIKEKSLPVSLIGITGGEPFLNPHIIDIIETILRAGHKLLILTNAYRVLSRWDKKLLVLNDLFPDKLFLRVSLDHFTKEIHEKERGTKTFLPTLKSIKWLINNSFNVSIAGRFLQSENYNEALKGFKSLFKSNDIALTLNENNLVLFPEMESQNLDTPEITVSCWSILGKSPDSLMCSSERMVVKPKGKSRTKVQACTLIPYEKEFELGESLSESSKKVFLNHPFCSSFCVLGGSSCSSTY